MIVIDRPPYWQWGQNLRDLRLSRGFRSQRVFAETVGVSKNAVAFWERGEIAPTDRHKAAVARALGVNASTIFPISAIQEQP